MIMDKRLYDSYFGAVNLFLPANIAGYILVIGDNEELVESLKIRGDVFFADSSNNASGISFFSISGNDKHELSKDDEKLLFEKKLIIVVDDEVVARKLVDADIGFFNVNKVIGIESLIDVFYPCIASLRNFKRKNILIKSTGEIFSETHFNNSFLYPLRMYFENNRFIKSLLLRMGTIFSRFYTLIFNERLLLLEAASDKSTSLFDNVFEAATKINRGKKCHIQRCMTSSAHVVIMELVGFNGLFKGLLLRIPLNNSSKKRFLLNYKSLEKVKGTYAGIKGPVLIQHDKYHNNVFSFETIVDGLDSWELDDIKEPTISAGQSLIQSVAESSNVYTVDDEKLKHTINSYLYELTRVCIIDEVEQSIILSEILEMLSSAKIVMGSRHGDFKLENMRVKNNQVVGIFDFDLFSDCGIEMLDLIHLIGSNYYIQKGIDNITDLTLNVLLPFKFEPYEVQLFEQFPFFKGFEHSSWKAFVLLYWLDHMVRRHVIVLNDKASLELTNKVRTLFRYNGFSIND